ncbi:MAG: precorrin-3B C(17)-methyltransferase [candidate division NC10 bacterium]|nr:precorrin-3B C(17)-methyltransferase [Candidatus Rokubacteria bacterium]MBI2563068.1 precorrin-3B C(17)-methyltransferase [candidate division NC10 bacterium]
MKLYAIGVGPGAPDLLTLRASKILERVPVIFSPLSAMGTTSRALDVVRGVIDPSRQQVVELTFPMQKEQDELESEWEEAAGEIVEHLRRHGEGAFITIGDVSLYSTFIYVQRILEAEHPDLLIEMVPGIPSFSAMTALMGMPYGQGDDRIAILPATFGPERIAEVLRDFETVILMKVNRVIDEVLDTLERLGLTEHATFVTKCGMPDQEVVHDVRALRGQRPSYFSILLVTKTARPSGTAVAPPPPHLASRIHLDAATKADGMSQPARVQPARAEGPPAEPEVPSKPGGKLFLVGFGPGNHDHLTFRAKAAIGEADVIIGYRTYVRLVRDLIQGKEVHYTGMTEELERARKAVSFAYAGRKVALISSGDVGIYGMAGPALEILKEKGWRRGCGVEVEVVPGVTALSACASILGAPVVHDFAAISLSNLLTPWEVIVRRIEAAARADYVIALYNPKSGRRTQQIAETQKILLRYRRPDTPVGVVKSGLRQGQRVVQTTLADMLNHEIGMLTTILIGNSTTFTYEGLMITPRGYQHKYELPTLEGAVADASEAMMAGATLGIDPFLGRKKGTVE